MNAIEAQSEDVASRVDQLYEFEREPVTPEHFESGRHFAAVYAGEHVAGTEFVIGALFVTWGAGASDVLWGLIVGNLLAVLSWTLVCAPIAVQTRLTLYWYLRKIAGPTVTTLYNVLNAILFCVLSGTMITVSASAVRIPFGIPAQTNWYPEDWRFVLLVIGVGAVVVSVAILGFRRLAQFAEICVPWIFCMFFAGALTMLPALARALPEVGAVNSASDLWTIANEMVWVRRPDSTIGFWHIAAFAWICNLAFHLGLSDMALLRYAPKASYGLFSACGMYLGHFLAWICAGVMGAAAAHLLSTPLPELDAGGVAYQALGISGALAVIIAGWATSNPTLYRAGLALQAITPGWPRWVVTLVAGVFTTAIACFPFVFGYLLQFVALFGIVLMPVGTIVLLEHFLFPRIGWTRYWASLSGNRTNWPALVAWLVAIGASIALVFTGTLDAVFLAIPIWLLTAAVYLLLCKFQGGPTQQPSDDLPTSQSDTAVGNARQSDRVSGVDQPSQQPSPNRPVWLTAVGWLGAITLAVTVALPVWVLLGSDQYETRLASCHRWLVWASVIHLVCLTVWVLSKESGSPTPGSDSDRAVTA